MVQKYVKYYVGEHVTIAIPNRDDSPWFRSVRVPGGSNLRGGNVDKDGYGHYAIMRQGKIRQYRVHRYVWEQVHGEIPDGLLVRHTCDVRRCFRIEHLMLGTAKDNHTDKIERERAVPFVRQRTSREYQARLRRISQNARLGLASTNKGA